ncbi:MAG: tetratricopeptide repeat protein [Acidobacteria bacterium]|nr:tetratricopeptide repeat protein [Acidobacteriota bacterium]
MLKVKAVADEAFREKGNWEKEIREHVEWADKEFRKFAGIGLQLVATDRWSTHESDSMSLLLHELRHAMEKGDADIVVGFTGHKPPEFFLNLGSESIYIRFPFIAGIAFPLGDRAVVRRHDGKKETRHTFLHEIAHLFGGVHVKEESILQTGSRQTNFVLDPFNQRVFEMTRSRDFNRALPDLTREEIEALVALYRQAPLRDERDFDTNIRVGYLFLVAGDPDAAVEEFEKAIAIDPGETMDLIRGAIIPEFEAYAEEHGTTVQTRFILGRAHATIREWNKAADYFNQNCFAAPPHAPSCGELGAVLLQGRNPQGAEMALKRALELDESLVNVHNNLGILYAAAGQTSKALAHFNRAAELEPNKPTVHFNMGMAYLTLDLLEPAADAFRRVLELRPKQDDARVKLALVLARQGQTKQARKQLGDLHEATGEVFLGPASISIARQLSPQLYRDMAEIFFRDGDSKKAWQFLGLAKKGGLNVTELEQEMVAGTPKPRKVKTEDLVEQAEAYYDKERYQEARSLLERARTQSPKEEKVYYWLGRIARQEGKPEEAAQYQQGALARNSKYAGAYLELARLAVSRKDYAAAIPHLNKYVEVSSYPTEEVYYLLGSCHMEQGDLPAAEENLKKAIQGDSGYGDAFFLLAELYAKQNRKQEAIAEFNLALGSRSLDADHRSEAHYKLARLLKDSGQAEEALKHARIAHRLGHAGAVSLLAELEEEPEAEGDEMPPGGMVFLPQGMQGERRFTISDAVVGEPPGRVRAGQALRGRVRVKKEMEAAGEVTLSLRVGAVGETMSQVWLFAPIEVPAGLGEKQVTFTFPLPPGLPAQGEFFGVLAVMTPPELSEGRVAPPKLLSNELEVAFRIVP